jgi:hypothetical protein
MNFPTEAPVLEAADCLSRCSPRVEAAGEHQLTVAPLEVVRGQRIGCRSAGTSLLLKSLASAPRSRRLLPGQGATLPSSGRLRRSALGAVSGCHWVASAGLRWSVGSSAGEEGGCRPRHWRSCFLPEVGHPSATT